MGADPSNRRQMASDAFLAAMFSRFARMRPLIGQAPPAPRIVELKLKGQMFRAECNARFLTAMLPARPGVRPRPWLIFMSLN